MLVPLYSYYVIISYIILLNSQNSNKITVTSDHTRPQVQKVKWMEDGNIAGSIYIALISYN